MLDWWHRTLRAFRVLRSPNVKLDEPSERPAPLTRGTWPTTTSYSRYNRLPDQAKTNPLGDNAQNENKGQKP